jgi:hypothetical protein
VPEGLRCWGHGPGSGAPPLQGGGSRCTPHVQTPPGCTPRLQSTVVPGGRLDFDSSTADVFYDTWAQSRPKNNGTIEASTPRDARACVQSIGPILHQIIYPRWPYKRCYRPVHEHSRCVAWWLAEHEDITSPVTRHWWNVASLGEMTYAGSSVPTWWPQPFSHGKTASNAWQSFTNSCSISWHLDAPQSDAWVSMHSLHKTRQNKQSLTAFPCVGKRRYS